MHGECTVTGKVRYASARAAYAAVQKSYWARRTKVQPRRVYCCKHCQGYHLSSKGDVWGRRHRLLRTDEKGLAEEKGLGEEKGLKSGYVWDLGVRDP